LGLLLGGVRDDQARRGGLLGVGRLDRIVVQPSDAEQTTASDGWTTMRSSSGLMATLVAVVTVMTPSRRKILTNAG